MRLWASPVVVAAAIASMSVVACSTDHLGPTAPPVDAGGNPPMDAGTVQPVDARIAPADASPPFGTTFRFRNDTAAPLFLHKGCVGTDFGVSSETSGFRDRLGPTYHCACLCEEASCSGPVACGACPASQGLEVAPGGSLDSAWDALQITDDEKPRSGVGGGTFGCVHTRLLSAASYRVAVRVFDDETSAAGNVGGRVVTRSFALPTGGPVDVPLSANAADTCDPTPASAAPTCTGAEARDVPCSLGEPLAFAWEGGLSFSGDASQLTPPTTYARRRTFYIEPMPDMTCATTVPRCTRDSRVVTTSDVARVINDPGVLSSYGATTPVYGYDYRANDGSVLVLRRSDGTSLAIGTTCSGCSPGVVENPLTPALSAVVPVLADLDRQMLSTTGCVALRQPGNYY